ncbi:hypothetical protein ACVI1I_004007 [Bradyrhizobium sp. USDA 4459]
MHVKGHAVERDDAAEHDADAANGKQGRCPLRELCLRHVVSPTDISGRTGDASRSLTRQRLSEPLGHTRNFSS